MQAFILFLPGRDGLDQFPLGALEYGQLPLGLDDAGAKGADVTVKRLRHSEEGNMELMTDDQTDIIVFQPPEVVDRDDDEPTMPPAPRGEATLEELHREMERASGPWLKTLIGAAGEATRKRGSR